MSLQSSSSPPVSTLPSVPDGGWTAWLTVFGAWLALFSTFGYINAFGVFQDYYTRIYLSNVSPSAVSWIGSFQFFVPLIMGMVSGGLFDKGYFHHIMLLGSIIFVFSLFMLSLAKEHQYYQIFLSQGLGMGLGLGLVFTPAISISSHHFKKKRAMAAGIALSGSSVGAVVHPILLNNLFNDPRTGFPGAVRASAYMLLGCLAIANLTMRTRLPPRAKDKLGPSIGDRLKPIITDSVYLCTITGSFFCQLSVYFPAFYIQLYANTHGIDEKMAFYSIAILNAASVIGRIIPNILADKVGAFTLVIPITVICAALMFAMLGITNVATMVVVAVIYGVFSGAYLALIVAAVVSLSRSPEELGLRNGLTFTTNSFAALIGTPIAGALLTDRYHWIRAIIFSAVCVLVGAAFFTVARWLGRNRVK
ncbi:hypothetical protein FOMPIDRAFT_60020 [Fomitopsis schrenkii]|uniref:Major facilitator superfamily (MFS) profile domain-containing protein n=1 Tax=Fomitopsis schrenkii TaxID=2126942 RepID=S8DJH7_FOMSC|nr:hypothetical protein FOMPIDRAFT_60020 [Fomitopsis schrenkii]